MNVIKVTDEEYALILRYREEQYNKNRPDLEHPLSDCRHVGYCMEGDYCALNKGYGVGNHCWVQYGKECKGYEELD